MVDATSFRLHDTHAKLAAVRAARRGQARPRARDLVEATPDSRNRYVDLIRVVSIAAVVIGHWMLAVLGFTDGAFMGHNLLELEPDLQILTWVFQVMPLFFIVGGFTNGTSWISASTRGTTYAEWLTAKSSRLIRPALWFVAFWTLLPVLAVVTGLLSADVACVGGQEVALPLWFLAVYLVAVAAMPALVVVHRRYRAWTLAGARRGGVRRRQPSVRPRRHEHRHRELRVRLAGRDRARPALA